MGGGTAGQRGSLNYGVLADLVVALHFGFVIFVVLGGLLVLRWRWVAYLHIPAVLWGVWIELAGWICPLTPLENALRTAAGGSAYQGDFVQHYILPVLYPSALTRNIQLLLGCLVVALNLGIYSYVLRLSAKNGTSDTRVRGGDSR